MFQFQVSGYELRSSSSFFKVIWIFPMIFSNSLQSFVNDANNFSSIREESFNSLNQKCVSRASL